MNVLKKMVVKSNGVCVENVVVSVYFVRNGWCVFVVNSV